MQVFVEMAASVVCGLRALRFVLGGPTRFRDDYESITGQDADEFGKMIYELIAQNEFCKPKLQEVKKKPKTEEHEAAVEKTVDTISTAADSPTRVELVEKALKQLPTWSSGAREGKLKPLHQMAETVVKVPRPGIPESSGGPDSDHGMLPW